MVTDIIDLHVYINNKPIHLINTDISVVLAWDIEISKESSEAKIKYSFHCIYGKFYVNSEAENYSKKSEYKFKTDETWQFSHVPYCADTISPTSAIINFDFKTVKIKF